MSYKNYYFKIDLDLKLPKEWKKMYLICGRKTLKSLGHEVLSVKETGSSKRGHHFVFCTRANEQLSSTTCNMIQFLLNDDIGRVIINQRRIERGISWREGNKLFDRTIWKAKHKCNCKIHNRIFRNQKEGQMALLSLDNKVDKK